MSDIFVNIGTGASSDGLADLVDDLSPQLGSHLDVNGFNIASTAAGDIVLLPDTTGDVIIDGNKMPQGFGNNGEVLQTNGAGQTSWAAASAGTLTALSDTTITTLGTDELLFSQDGVTWINQTLSEAGIEPADATILKDADIGVNVQAYSATNALTTDITYGTLDTNGDVGTSAGQLAIGNHTHTGVYEPANATILVDADIGVNVQAYDATILVDADIGVNVASQSHNHTGVYEPANATILVDADIGVNVQAYDSTILVDADIGVNVQAYDSTLLNDADIGVNVASFAHTHGADDLTDVTIATPLDKHALMHNGAGQFVNRLLVEADISDLGTYSLTSHNHTGVYEPADATILVDADIGVNVQAYDANILALKSNLVATAAPAVTDDTAGGYAVGSVWIDVTGDKSYVCVDATNSAAVWVESGSAGAFTASSTDTLTNKTINTASNTITVVEADISDLQSYILAAGVTYGNLDANGDVGTGATQVSQGTHTHTGVYEPANATILVDADIGVNVQAYDATILVDADIGVNVQAYDATIVVDADIGVTVQGYDADLAKIAALSSADSNFIVGSATGWVAESGVTARASLGVAIGSQVQAYDATILNAADIGTSVQAYDATNVVDADVVYALLDTNGDVGTSAGQLAIGNHTHSGVYEPADATILKDADIGVTVQAYDAVLADIAALTVTKGNIIAANATDYVALAIGTNDYVLTADSTAATGMAWKAAAGLPTLNDVTDVTITTVATGELLVKSAGDWINQTLSEAGIEAVGHTHVENDITDLQAYTLPADIVYSLLDTNGDVGTSAGQLAIGNHTHTGVYEPADATIVKDVDIGVNVQAYDATILVDADIGVNVQAYSATNTLDADVVYALLDTNGDVGTSAGQLAIGNHTHTGVYEPANATILVDADIGVNVQAYDATNVVDADVTYALLNTNGDVGTSAGQLAIGNHNHSGVYEPANATILVDADIGVNVQAYSASNALLADVDYERLDTNGDVGTSAGQLAIGNHTHLLAAGATDVTALAAELNLLDLVGLTAGYVTTASWKAPAAGAEVNDLTAAVTWDNIPIANVPTGTSSSTVSLGNHTHTGVYEPSDAGLTSIAGLTTLADRMIYTTASDTYAVTPLTAFARSILDDANEATFKATVNLEPGVDVQAYDATNVVDADVVYALLDTNGDVGTSAGQLAIGNHTHTGVYEPADGTILKDADIGVTVEAKDAGLTSIAGLTTVADRMIYTTASDTYAVSTLTAAGRALIDDASASAQRATLGLDKFDLTFQISTGEDATFNLHQYAQFAYTIDKAYYKTTSGTITAAIKIDGTDVTSLSALAITSTEGNATASAANTVSVGNTVSVVTTSNSTAVNTSITLHCTRS